MSSRLGFLKTDEALVRDVLAQDGEIVAIKKCVVRLCLHRTGLGDIKGRSSLSRLVDTGFLRAADIFGGHHIDKRRDEIANCVTSVRKPPILRQDKITFIDTFIYLNQVIHHIKDFDDTQIVRLLRKLSLQIYPFFPNPGVFDNPVINCVYPKLTGIL